MDDVRLLSYIGYVIHLINTIVYLKGFTKNGKAFKAMTVYIVYIGIVQLVTEIYASHGRNNHHLATYYMFGQLIFLSIFFYYLFRRLNLKIANIIKYTSIIATSVLAVQYIITPSLYFTFNPVGFLITCTLLIIYTVIYLYELLTQKSYFYYATIGTLIYLMSSALIFAAAVSIVKFKGEMSFYVWKINGVLYILYQLLLLWEWKQNFSQKAAKQD